MRSMCHLLLRRSCPRAFVFKRCARFGFVEVEVGGATARGGPLQYYYWWSGFGAWFLVCSVPVVGSLSSFPCRHVWVLSFRFYSVLGWKRLAPERYLLFSRGSRDATSNGSVTAPGLSLAGFATRVATMGRFHLRRQNPPVSPVTYGTLRIVRRERGSCLHGRRCFRVFYSEGRVPSLILCRGVSGTCHVWNGRQCFDRGRVPFMFVFWRGYGEGTVVVPSGLNTLWEVGSG